MNNYSIGDFLIQIKNAAMAKTKEITVSENKIIKASAEALKKAGFLDGFSKEKNGKLKIALTFKDKKPLLMDIKLVSKPGLRIYMSIKELEKIKKPSTFLISTPKGIVTSKEAVKNRIGGEVIAEIWQRNNMSKIGKLPIKIENGVEVKIENRVAYVTGPKGSLKLNLPRGVNVEVKEGFIIVSSKDESKEGKSKFGTIRAHLNNMVKGVTAGWMKKLELVGTGYRVETTGKELTLTIGFSHPVKVMAKEGITLKVEKLVVTVDGADKEVVGQTAAEIRSIKPPEPYKGKGIKYVDEVIRRKAGKAAKTVGAA